MRLIDVVIEIRAHRGIVTIGESHHALIAAIHRSHFPSCFAGDLPLAEAQMLASIQRPVGGAIFANEMGTPAWKTIKSWYQVSEDDQMIPPDTERMMASRAKATTISLKSSHASRVSHRNEIAELIIAAARS